MSSWSPLLLLLLALASTCDGGFVLISPPSGELQEEGDTFRISAKYGMIVQSLSVIVTPVTVTNRLQ